MKKSSSINTDTSTPFDSPRSPLRHESPLRSDAGDPAESPDYHSPVNSPDNSKAIVPVEKIRRSSPVRSPALPVSETPPVMVFDRARKENPPPSATNLAPASGGGDRRGRSRSAASTTPAWSRKEEMVKKAALGFRFSEVVLCLISFSVMAADKTQGWSGDSFDRYVEYRYCLSVNVIAFVYSGFQASDLAYQLVTGKHIINHHLRYHFDFFVDQVIAYLLISASSSAATRVDDWQSNWGKDEFTEMASASVALSFLAFIAFAISSLISGYNLCTRSSI